MRFLLLFLEEHLFEPVDENAGEVAGEGYPRDFLHVPAEGYLFQSHDYDACCGADDEHRAAYAGTVGQQLPEDAVDGHCSLCGYGVHAHAAGYEWHIIDNGRQHADDAVDDVVVAGEGFVKTLAEGGENADFLKYGNGHEDAEEEHDGGEVYAGQQVADALGHGVVLSGVVVEYFGYGPQDAEHQQDAHERRQVGERLEDGHEAEAANAEPEDDVALALGKLRDIGLRQVLLFVELARQLILQYEGRHEH